MIAVCSRAESERAEAETAGDLSPKQCHCWRGVRSPAGATVSSASQTDRLPCCDHRGAVRTSGASEARGHSVEAG